MVSIDTIQFKAGSRIILQDITARLQPGRLTVLLGANGAGKSTLLKLIAGEKNPSAGRIALDNRLLSEYSSAELAVQRAVLTQQYAIALPFKCKEVVMMGRYPHFNQVPSTKDEAIVRLCMEDMMVDSLADRWFHTLSGGEQQRVQMARVLAQIFPIEDVRNKLLLLDEPTSSMDCLHQQLCLRKAKELAQAGCTVVIVLHDLNLAAQYADDVILLKNGKLLETGTTAEVFQPAFIQRAYGFEVDIIHHPGYAFPIIIPVPQPVRQNFQTTKKIA